MLTSRIPVRPLLSHLLHNSHHHHLHLTSPLSASQPIQPLLHSLTKQFPSHLVLIRVGGFYEAYSTHADVLAQSLGMKVSRSARRTMAGFPHAALGKYLHELVMQRGKNVVLVEEKVQVLKGKRVISRAVSRVYQAGVAVPEGGAGAEAEGGSVVLCVVQVDLKQSSRQSLEQSLKQSSEQSSKQSSEQSLKQSSEHTPEQSSEESSRHSPKQGGPQASAGTSAVNLAWQDTSTGQSYIQQNVSVPDLRAEMMKINPRLVVLPPSASLLSDEIKKLTSSSSSSSFSSPSAQMQIVDFQTVDDSAYATLQAYLSRHLQGAMPITPRQPIHIDSSAVMQLDAVTVSGLEITSRIQGGVSGALLSTVRRTKSPAGARLLGRWITRPSTVLAEIHSRLDCVQVFLLNAELRAAIQRLFKAAGQKTDVARTMAVFMKQDQGRYSLPAISHFQQLHRGLQLVKDVRDAISKLDEADQGELRMLLKANSSDIGELLALFDRIVASNDANNPPESSSSVNVDAGGVDVLDDPTVIEDENEDQLASQGNFNHEYYGLHDPWKVNKDANAALKDLHEKYSSQMQEGVKLKKLLEAEMNLLKAGTGIRASLIARKNERSGPVVQLSYFNDVSGLTVTKSVALNQMARLIANSEKTKFGIIAGGSINSTSFKSDMWTKLHDATMAILLKIRAEQDAILRPLYSQVVSSEASIQTNAALLDQIDVLSSFAQIASELNLKRPDINSSKDLAIVGGRHLSVESACNASGTNFVPNDLDLSGNSRACCLTGVNMGGKSTFLRQNALIVILGQAGSYVPAESASWGVVDRIFSRVGASDDLAGGRSTFYVEMEETSNILHNATDRSLVLADEIGRGTATGDGVSVAAATLLHVMHVNKSRTLFATHFCEIADMMGYGSKNPLPNLNFACIPLKEHGEGRWSFTHQVTAGVVRNSQGLKVAELAGVPPAAISLAQGILTHLPHKSHEGHCWDSKIVSSLIDNLQKDIVTLTGSGVP